MESKNISSDYENNLLYTSVFVAMAFAGMQNSDTNVAELLVKLK